MTLTPAPERSAGKRAPSIGGRARHLWPGSSLRTGRLVTAAAVLALAVAGVRVIQTLGSPPAGAICVGDAVQARAVGGLVDFDTWLRREGAQGFVGEVGWPSGPDQDAWASVGEAWYKAADAAGLPVTAWSAGRWGASYPMAIYRPSSDTAGVDSAGPQARVVERHPSRLGVARGVAVASGAFGADAVASTGKPGRYGIDYTYGSSSTYTFLAQHGVKLIRLAIVWERLQHTPFAPLDATEVRRLRQVLQWAAQLHLKVVLDLHGYGDMTVAQGGKPQHLLLGSPALPVTAFADLWRRLARATVGQSSLAGYDLLNEPVHLAMDGSDGARLWEHASQAAVDSVRGAGGRGTVLVSSYGSTSPVGWPHLHDKAWIHDPLSDVAYEAHAYFDADGSGHYAHSYAAESAAAQGATARDAVSAGTCVTVPGVPAPSLRRWTS